MSCNFTYDTYGNNTKVSISDGTNTMSKTGDGSVSCNFTYDTYGNNQWGDLLTGYDGRTFSYDTIGNLTSDGIRTYTWQHGRQLATLSDGTTTWSYTYNADGLRTKKTAGTNIH